MLLDDIIKIVLNISYGMRSSGNSNSPSYVGVDFLSFLFLCGHSHASKINLKKINNQIIV